MNYSQKNNTAILVFANSSEVDELRKGMADSKPLFDELTKDVIHKVKRTKLPFFVFNEDLQIGSDFGTRFTTAIQTVFAKGYENIIALGNDTPHLTAETIWQSYQNLTQGKTVVGPSSDGGVYLLGIQKSKFSVQEFMAMPWQKRTLFAVLSSYFLGKGILCQLPRLRDVDSIEDISPILNSRYEISVALTSALLRFVQKTKMMRKTHFPIKSLGLQNRNFNKGSPLLFS